MPFNTVLESSQEEKRVAATPSKIKPVRIPAVVKEDKTGFLALPVPMKNSVISIKSVGNLPLQGTNEFVSIAISRSLGESIIRHPTTPAALQPMPIAMYGHCRQSEVGSSDFPLHVLLLS